MEMKKILAALAVGAAMISGIAFQNQAEASYGVFDMGSMRSKKSDPTAKAPEAKTANKANNKTSVRTVNPNARPGFNMVNWSLTGTITQGKKGLDNAALYVVEYDDGTEVPKYHMEENTMVFDNVAKGQLVSCTKTGGNYVSLDFKAGNTINVIVFAPYVGMRYFTLEKRNYLGKFDFDFGALDDTKAAVYHDGII